MPEPEKPSAWNLRPRDVVAGIVLAVLGLGAVVAVVMALRATL